MQLTSNITAQANTIVFIDAAVEDYQTLAANLEPGTEVVILDAARDGVAQITEVLRERTAIDSVQIVSHGSDGLLQLGTTELSNENLAVYEKQLQQWGEALNVNGDILLYGCNVAATDAGKGFIEQLSQITQAEIAASDDLSGNAELGGDWVLEYATGLVKAPLAFQVGVMDAYDAVLATIEVTNNNNSGSGSLRQAILDAANNGQDGDIIDLSGISGQTITLNDNDSSLPTIREAIEIKGAGVTIYGNSIQIIAVDAQSNTNKVIFSNLNFENGLALGGTGRNGGGGGLGAGGALFINSGSVVIDGGRFFRNKASGGSGFRGARGGNEGENGNTGGQGGGFNEGAGFLEGARFTSGFTGKGGISGDGGGGRIGFYLNGADGGKGSYGSGGGAGGGGGGGNNTLFGRPGEGGEGGEGGPFAGDGTDGSKGSKQGEGGDGGIGGGGAGLGGAIFVKKDANLTLINSRFENNTAEGGEGGFGDNNGQGEGNNIFVMKGATVKAYGRSNIIGVYNDNQNNKRNPIVPSKLPTVSISSNNNAAEKNGFELAETDAYFEFKLNNNQTFPVDLTVNFTVDESAENSAKKDTDYQLFVKDENGNYELKDGKYVEKEGDYKKVNNSVIIPAGQTSATINVATIDDEIYEGDETVKVTLLNSTNYTLGSSKEATLTITDDEPLITLEKIQDATEGGQGEFKLTLDKPAPRDTLVKYTIAGSATPNQDNNDNPDYQPLTGSVLISSGQSSAVIDVTSIDDRINEENETIILTLQQDEDRSYGIKGDGEATLTIKDNDKIPTASITNFTNPSEPNTNGNFTISLDSPALEGGATVNYTVTGTAINGVDYQKLSGSVFFEKGQQENKINIPLTVKDDAIAEDDETIVITLSEDNSENKSYLINDNNKATLKITDNDSPGVTLSTTELTTNEGGTASFKVNLNTQPTKDVKITFVSGNIDEGTLTNNDLTFTSDNWNTAQIVTVAGVDDTVEADNPLYEITGSIETEDSKYQNVTVNSINVTNIDNEGFNVLIAQTDSNTQVTEAGATDTYEISLSKPPQGNVEIIITADEQTEVNVNKVVFTPNDNSPKTITITAKDDAVIESNHVSIISHEITTSDDFFYPTSLEIADVKVSITDNDFPTVKITSIESAKENISNGKVELALDAPALEPITVNYSVDNGNDESITIDKGQTGNTISLDAANDDEFNPNKTLNINLNNGSNYNLEPNNTSATVNIVDDDIPGITITETGINTEVAEGGNTDSYSLVLDSKPTADVTVEFVTDTDLQTIQPITFTATNWNQAQAVTVKAVEDEISEDTEITTITHKLSSTDTYYNSEQPFDYNGITIPNVPTLSVTVKDRTFNSQQTANGLEAALDKIEALIVDQLRSIELPIVGSLDKIAPNFIGSFKNTLITRIEAGNSPNQESLKEIIQDAIKDGFKSAGIDIEVEVNASVSLEEATFDITLGNTYNLLDVSLSSDLGLPALGINVDGDAEMTFDYSLGLGFGFHTDFGFFIDSEKTGFNAGISLGLSNDFKAQGSMGFLQLDLNNDADNLTEAKIDFNAGLNDLDNLEAEDGKPAEDDGERLTYKELIGDYKLKELFDVGLSGGANIGLSALTSFNGDAVFPAFGFDFAAGFDAEYSILSNEEEESTEEESAEEKSRLTFNQPTLAFNNVDLDIGSFVSDFAKPVVSKINEVIDPFRPIIDLLNTDTKLLNKLGIQSIFDENGDNKVTVLEMALAVAKISGKGGNAKYIEFFDAITKLSDLTEKINKFSDTDDSIIIELGSYEIDTSFDATDENADSTSATAKATEKKSLDEQLEILEDEVDNIKRNQVDIVKGFTGDADFLVPILTNPALVLGLLFGKDVSLFTYDLPVLQVGFEAEAVFDIYPPISGLLEGGVDVTLDLAFGYDTFGFNQWKALNFALEEVYRVFDGFYVSDTKIVDGKEIDINELVVKATIAVGLGLDFKVISAYLKGGIEGIIGLDLVDGGEVNGTDDGKLRVSEIIPRLKTPWELFQLSGVVNVFLGGEVKVIGATVWDERLATFKLAEFSVGPKGNSAGSVFDGDIVAGKVFFDANFNNIQDEFEPYTYSNVDGSYDLDIPLYLFDVNANGVIDDEEGQIVVVDGIDSSIFIEQKAPIITTNDATVASPLTTLAVTIAEPDLAAAQTLVAGVFNLPDNVDLLNYNPQKVDLSVFAIQSQLQNLIIPVTKEISKTIPVSEQIPASEIANLLFTALGNRISSDINPDLSDQDILTSIIEEVINQVEQKYSLNIDTIDIDQLAEIITGDNFSINDILADDSLDAATKRKEIAKITELPEIAGGFQQLVINPLATLTKTVVTAGNTATSQIQVKQALDIADVDLFNYDPLEAINEGDSNGLTVFAKQAQVQNTIVQLTKLVKGSSQESIEKAASDVIETIADKIASDTEVNLSDNNQVETLIKQTAPELENVAAGAADIITTGNKKIDAIVDDSKSDIDKALEIAKIQQVAQGEAADDLEEVGKGVKTIQDAVNENTGDGLVTQINATDVNNPTNRNVNTNEPTSLVLDPETQTWEITGNESIVPLKFALTGTDTDFVNEIGLFTVDDAENRIDGLLPGDAGYQEAALKRAKVIFSALPGNNPEVTRQLPFSGGMRLGFYMVANGTTDGVIQGGSNPGNIYFSVPEANAQGIKPLQVSEANGKFTLAWEDTPKLANTDFNDLLMTFEIQQQNLTLQQAIANFQGEKEGELFDLRLLAGREVQTDFPIVNSEASYNNVFGLYRVENKQGTVIDSISGESLNPGDAGYTAAAIRLSQSAEKGVSLNRNNQGLATTLEGGFLYAPFLIANGKPEAVLDDDTLNDPSVYFSFIQANSDGVDHVRLLGDNTIGFEDLANGGDRDYNDSVFQVNFSFV